MNPFRSHCPFLLLACAAWISTTGCNPDEREPERAPAQAVAGTTMEPAPPAAKQEVPEAIRELQAKIQPPGAPPPPAPPDETTLLARAEDRGRAFVEALRKGDPDARTFLFSRRDFEEAVTPGHRAILESSIVAQNEVVVERLAGAIRGKQVKVEWKPGALATGARAVFQKPMPILSTSTLEVDADGVPIAIRVDQMVYHNEEWKLFRLSLP